MRVRDLVVEFGREDHIARHGVTVAEVVEIIFDRPTFRRERNGHYRFVGQTIGGRYLTVFLVPIGGGVFSLVTARDATDVERRAHRAKRRR